MPQNRVNMVNIFQSVTQTLLQNQQVLDQVDDYNHNHGTNMVQTFQTITDSLQAKQGKSDRTALSYAAKKLAQTTSSGSGKLYAQGLAQAATKFKGKRVDSKGALDLLQTLIGGGQTSQSTSSNVLGTLLGQISGEAQSQPSGGAQPGSDMLGALLGQLTGESQPQPSGSPQSSGDLLGTLLGQATGGAQPKPSAAPPAGGDMLSTLLGSLTGGGSASSGAGSASGLDLGDLINAAMSYMQAKQGGGSTAQALVQAFMSASGMGSSAQRTQSTQLVINSFLQALASPGTAR